MAIAAEPMIGGGEHVVKFYEHDRDLVEAVAPYLVAGILAGQGTIVIATKAHRHALESGIRARGIDVARASTSGTFHALDAEDTMSRFLLEGRVDPAAFDEVIGELVRTVHRSSGSVRAYGEMVALLWEMGNVPVAIELEKEWNELARRVPFSLFCSYPSESAFHSEHADALEQVCLLHSAVLQPSAHSDPRAAEEDSATGFELAADFIEDRDSPGRARRLLVAMLREWGYRQELVNDAALVLSELANNAIVHARSPFSIEVRGDDCVLNIAVRDECPLTPAMREKVLTVRSGHGLGFIDVLCPCWGIEEIPTGKNVWAELCCEAVDVTRAS